MCKGLEATASCPSWLGERVRGNLLQMGLEAEPGSGARGVSTPSQEFVWLPETEGASEAFEVGEVGLCLHFGEQLGGGVQGVEWRGSVWGV